MTKDNKRESKISERVIDEIRSINMLLLRYSHDVKWRASKGQNVIYWCISTTSKTCITRAREQISKPHL